MLALNRKQPCNLQAEVTALKHALIWANKLKLSRIDIEVIPRHLSKSFPKRHNYHGVRRLL